MAAGYQIIKGTQVIKHAIRGDGCLIYLAGTKRALVVDLGLCNNKIGTRYFVVK
jgi:hypothetical protein